MKKPVHILIVEHRASQAELAKQVIGNVLKGAVFHVVETRADFLKSLKCFQPDVILAACHLPQFNGLQALKLASQQAPLTPFVVWLDPHDEDMMLRCIEAGANNYVLKNNEQRLGPAILLAWKERDLRLARRQAEEKYQAIFENSAVGIFQSSPQGRFLHANAAAARIYGYDSAQDLIDSVNNIAAQIYVDPAKRKEFQSLLLSQDVIENYEQRNYRKDGSMIWTSTSARAVRDIEGQVLYYEGFISDITARKQAEENLKERERQLTMLFGNLPGPVYRCLNDADYTMEFISEGIRELSGYQPEDFYQHRQHFGMMIHVEDRQRVWEEIQAAVESHRPFELTYRIITADGEEKWVWEKGQSIYGEQGQLQVLEGFITDITTRKQAEVAIQNNEKRFQALIENGLDDISLLTADGVLVWESPSTVRNLGYPPGTFIGRNIFELMHPDDLAWAMDLYEKLKKEPGGRQRGNFRLRRADGCWRWVEAIVTNLLDEPSVRAIVVNYRDVTERKEAEDALRESQKKYQHLVETSHDLIWSTDADGRITFVNSAAREIYGYEPEDLIGRSFFELMDREQYQNHLPALFREAIRSASEFNNMESFVRHRDGKQVILSANSIVIRDAQGKITGVTGSSRDVTVQKQVENTLHEERNLLRTLIDHLPDRIYVMDREGRKTISNTADWKACGGKTMKDVIGKTDYDLYPPELAGQFLEQNRAVLETGEPLIDYEEPGLDAEGNRVCVLTTKIPLHDEHGNVTGLVGIGRDITGQKQSEARIRDLLAFNEKILNHSSIGILAYKATGVCVFANENAACIVGTDIGHLLVQNFRTIDSWKKSGLYELVERAITTQAPVGGDVHHISTFGKEIWMTAHCVTFKSKDEDHVILCIEDISDRKQVEAALRFEKERFEHISATVPGIICSFRLRPDGSACMPFASPAIQDVYGFSPQDVQEDITPITSRIHPEDLARNNETIEESARTMLTWHNEFRYLHPTRGEIWIEGRSMPVREADGSIIWHGFVHDVTERKRAEAAEREQRVLAEALRDTAETLSRTLDYGEVLDHILSAAGRVVPHDAATVMLIENGVAHIVRARGYEYSGFAAKIMKVTLPLVETANLRLMYETGESVVVRDTHTYPGWKRMAETDWLRSSVGAPISLYGEVIGFILLDSQAPEFFQAVHAERLQAFANQAALAIHNARLLQQAQAEIAERKQAEKELRASEERFRQLAENLQEAVWMTDMEIGKEIYLSPAAETIWQRPVDELMKTPSAFVRTVYPSDRAAVLRGLAKQREGERVEMEYRIVRPDGTMRWVWDRAFPIFDDSGRVKRVAGISADITERRESELALVKSQSRYRELFDSSPTSLWEEDYSEVKQQVDLLLAKGITDLETYFCEHPAEVARLASLVKIIDVNRASLDLYHVTRKEELTKQLDQVLSPDALTDFHQEILGFLGPSKRFTRERNDVAHDGTFLQVMVAGSIPHGFEEDWSKVIISVSDITERKQAEIELRRRSDDLALLNAINQAVLRGEKLDSIGKLLSEEVKRIFSGQGCTIYMLSPDKQFITMQPYLIAPEIRERIERLIGYAIPAIEIPTKQGGLFQRVLSSRQSRLLRNTEEVQEWIGAFVETRFIPSLAKVALRRLIPQIYKVLNIKSTIIVPLSSDSEVVGLLDVSSPGLLTEQDLKRIENIARQLTSAIQGTQAVEALRESENKAKALLNALPDLMFRLDRAGNILDYKADTSELYAQNEQSLIHKNMRDISPAGFAELVANYTRQTLESNAMQVFEFQLTIPERGLRDYEARMVSSGADEVTAIVRDITEHKRNETETQRRADEFAALYKTARELAAQYNLPSLLNTIVERACTLLRSAGGGVYLYDEARGDLEMVLSRERSIPVGARIQMGEGMAGHVAQTCEPLIVDDYSKWEGRAAPYENIPFRAVLEAPMLYGGRLIGVLVVYEIGESDRQYTEVDAHLLSLFAEYAASAVHAARLMQETRRGAEETTALLKTSLALTNLELKATLQTIGNSAKTLFAADGCRVFLIEPDGETLRCVLALQENFAAFANLRIQIGEGVTGAVAATGQPEIVNEMQNDPRAVQVPGTPDLEPEAIMFAPLKDRERTIGVLSIRRAGEGRSFRPTDLELLEAFASMAASAVSKARLFEETQRRLAELEALYENGLAVGRLLNPEEIAERVIETFARYLRWHHVTIRLRRGDSDDLELVSFNLPNINAEEQSHARQYFVADITKVGQGLSGWVIQTGQPFRTGNVNAHEQYIHIQEGIQSGLYMPLKVGERVIGVISVESELPDAFSEQDERLLATLASQAAIAFENARLYQAIEQELTERKRAEDALRASETHYRELADSITDILFELDQDLHYTHWNKATEMQTGILATDAIGRSMQEIFGASEEQSRISSIYADVLKSRQPRTFETAMMVNGEKRYFEINAYPSTRGVSVVANDVTDRKRSESILQKRFELMEYAAHHSLNELMQKTTDEVSELTGSTIGFFHFVEEDQVTLGTQTWSTNALQLFNVPVNQGVHLSLDQAGGWAEAVRQRRPLIQNSGDASIHSKGLPEGHAPILREIVIPIIRNEKVMAVMGIGNKPHDYTLHDLEIAGRLADYAWDITERKQMELALEQERRQLVLRVEERTADLSRANSNLARALRVKDEFLANMSHELRTPLNSLLILSESLVEQIAGPLNEKQQKYITTISESGHHLLALINDILDLAKIEAGQITLDINKMDIHTVCQSSLRMIKQLAQKRNQDVLLDIEEDVGLMWADERRLKQMIVNLLGNAVKFTPDNGRIGLEVRGDREANKITITVWDTGIGIREEDLNRLFQPFVQLDSGLARETTGTGLGLALVAQMARLHGGSVSATSELGKGSRFSIVLPWEPALALDSAARLRVTGKFPAIKTDAARKPTILLVEDTKEVTMMLQDYLELAGYRIVTAQDGVDGLVQARLSHPDLILMDVQMPRMDGLEATRRLRDETEFRCTPIIALTALAMPNDRERCLAAGMDEYISKPVNLKALAKLIQSCLSQNGEVKPQ